MMKSNIPVNVQMIQITWAFQNTLIRYPTEHATINNAYTELLAAKGWTIADIQNAAATIVARPTA